MWATWANLGPRQGQTCAQIGPTSANNNNNNKKQGRQRQPQPQQQQQPRVKTGANLRPNRANIGQQQQQQQKTTTTTTTTTTTPEHGHGLHPTHTFHGSALAGTRLSGVSLINPGAGPGPQPVSLPEAFGGNRRLHRLAAPAADLPPTHDYRCNLQCILRVVFKKHRFLQGFVAFAVSRFHLGDVKKPWVFHGFGS